MNFSDSVFVQRVFESDKLNPFLRAGRVFKLMIRLFSERRIPVLAQSLAYTTIFTLVPILAAFFAVLGMVTDNAEVKEKIRQTIETYFFPEYVNKIFGQFDKLSAASTFFGVIGFPTLFLAGVFLYAKVYTSINEIWLSEKRSMWFKNLMSFFMTLFFGPMILVLVFSLPPYLQTIPYFQTVVSFVYVETLFTHLIPLSIIFVGLFVLYLYIPVIRVKLHAALRGALIAAMVIQLSNYAVSYYLKSFAKLDVIYGSLAIFPIFLLWVYVIWLVVLSGAVLAFIFHYHSHSDYQYTKGMYNDQSLLCSALQVLMFLVQDFQTRGHPPGFDQIQLMLGMNRRRLSHILTVLSDEKLIVDFEKSDKSRKTLTRYQLAMNPEQIYLVNLIPCFYQAHDHQVFEEALNELIKILDIHPGFFIKDINLQHLLKQPGVILNKMKKIIQEVEQESVEMLIQDQTG